MNVAAILKVKGDRVLTASPHAKVVDIVRQLADQAVGSLVVTGTTGRIEGIVSERDIIKAVAARGAGCLAEPVANVMTRDVTCCELEDTVDELMAQMSLGHFRHLPVVEDGKLVGIVSIGDVVKHHIAEVEMEAGALSGYISAD